MSTRAQLSETLNRLLPGEKNKRIRTAILEGANYSGVRTDQLRQSIDESNRLRTGRLVAGTVTFTSTTNADVSGFAWTVDYEVFQQDALESITVLAPHAEFARPDYFVGLADGSVAYRAGTIDALGNARFPTVANDEVLLYSVLRKSDESNVNTPLDPAPIDHNATRNIQGGKPAIGDQPAEHYHQTHADYLKILKLIANISANSVSLRGLTTFTAPTSADSTDWKWIIANVEYSVTSETNATSGTPATYPRPDFFIGKTDGTIDYRPGVIDEFGNPTLPDIADDEVILDVVLRDPDGNNSSIPPEEYFDVPFPNFLYQTAVQADTEDLYAPVWRATVNANNSYHLHLNYGAPSSEADWDTVNSGRSGLLSLTFFCLAGLEITGITFETFDGKSQPGDWVLLRDGDEVTLYHKSSDYWMRVYYRAVFLGGAAFKSQMLNRQIYDALPSGDQSFDSTPFGFEFLTIDQLPQYGLLNGGTIQYRGDGLWFQWAAAVVGIGGVLNAPDDEIELAAADPTLNREDLLGWLKTGPTTAVPHVITGTPGPVFAPPPYDPTTFLAGIPVKIPAAATVPDGTITTENVYIDNAQWTVTKSGTGTLDADSTDNPSTGTKAVKSTGTGNGYRVRFTRSAVLDLSTLTDATLGMDTDLIAAMQNNMNLHAVFLDDTATPVSSQVTLTLNKASTAYQFLALDLTAFSFTSQSVKHLEIVFTRSGGGTFAGFYLDNVKIQGGVEQPVQSSVKHDSTTEKKGGDPILGEWYHVTKNSAEGLEASGATAADPVAKMSDLPAAGIPDAPSDGSHYARKDGSWVSFVPGIQHAPSDGSYYASRNGAWASFVPFTVAGTPSSGDVVTYVAGVPTWQAPSGGGGGGISGLTTNYIPKATSASTIGDSRITDDGTTIGVIGPGSASNGASLAYFQSGTGVTAGNLYGIGVGKQNAGAFFFGINKNSVTGQIPSNSAFISTYGGSDGISIGRGGGAFLPNSADIYINGSGNIGFGRTDQTYKVDVSGNLRASLSQNNLANTVGFFYSLYNNVDANPTVAYPVLRLERVGKSGAAFGSSMDFGVSRYEASGTNARTELVMRLAHGGTATPEVTLMKFRSNGQIILPGIPTSNPLIDASIYEYNDGTRTYLCISQG